MLDVNAIKENAKQAAINTLKQGRENSINQAKDKLNNVESVPPIISKPNEKLTSKLPDDEKVGEVSLDLNPKPEDVQKTKDILNADSSSDIIEQAISNAIEVALNEINTVLISLDNRITALENG